MSNLKTTSAELSVNITTDIDFIKELYHINQIANYPVSDLNLETWAKSIKELTPEITPEILKKIINKYKTGYYKWDSKVGIPNIFNGYHLLILEKIEWLAHNDQFKNEKEIDKLNFIIRKI